MIADSVRLALPNEAEGITAVQRRSWEATVPPEIAGPLLASVSEDEMVQRWCEAIVRPPNAKIRVLVAVSGELVVGFACVGPSGDPDADLTTGTIAEFVVDPRATRRGHGSPPSGCGPPTTSCAACSLRAGGRPTAPTRSAPWTTTAPR